MIKKTLLKRVFALFVLGYFILPTIVLAETAKATYAPLTTIPGAFTACADGDSANPSCTKADPVSVIKNIYGISINIAATLAVAMIIWAGIQYATTEAITGKSDAKQHWEGAIWGLVLLLSAYLILRTINIDLVKVNLDLGTGIVTCTGYLKDSNGNTLKDASGAPIPCNSTSATALTDSLNAIQNNVNSMLADSGAKQKAVDDAKTALENAKKTGDATATANAQKAVDDAVAAQIKSATDGITSINTSVNTMVTVAQNAATAGVASKDKTGFATYVTNIDSSLTGAIDKLQSSLSSATSETQKTQLSAQIAILNDKKTMTDVLLGNTWKAEEDVYYHQTDSNWLGSTMKQLAEVKSSVLSRISDPNSADATVFVKGMDDLISRVKKVKDANGD